MTTTNKERLIAIQNAITWSEAKQQRLLINPTINLTPVDAMLNDDGYLYPTRLYTAARLKLEGKLLPVKYDSEYVLAYYQLRVIKELSLDSQLKLLGLINDMYSLDDKVKDENTLLDSINSLDDATKLQLCKDMAKSLGKRLIAK